MACAAPQSSHVIFPRTVSEKQDFLKGKLLRQEEEQEQQRNMNLEYRFSRGRKGLPTLCPALVTVLRTIREAEALLPLGLGPSLVLSPVSRCQVIPCLQPILASQCPEVKPELLTIGPHTPLGRALRAAAPPHPCTHCEKRTLAYLRATDVGKAAEAC